MATNAVTPNPGIGTDTPNNQGGNSNTTNLGGNTTPGGTGGNTTPTTPVVPSGAVTQEQLKNVLQHVGNNVSHQIAAAKQEARSGTALAIATASLPQSYMPGRSMIAAAGGSFKGENAVALGVSRISDNGKVVFKLNGSMTSRGDAGVGVGVGYTW